MRAMLQHVERITSRLKSMRKTPPQKYHRLQRNTTYLRTTIPPISTSIHASPRISSTAFQKPQNLHFEPSSCPTSDTGKPVAVHSIGLGLGLRLAEDMKVAIFGGTKVCTKSDLSATQVQDLHLRFVFFASSLPSMSSFSFASTQARKGPALDEPPTSSPLGFRRTSTA